MDIRDEIWAFCEKHDLFPSGFAALDELNAASGLHITQEEFDEEPAACYASWLVGMKMRFSNGVKPSSAPGPRKPTPALPVEVYSQTAFDADRAHDALMALCRGS